MRSIILVVRNEFIRSLKYRKKLILSMLVPILVIIAAAGINDFMKPSINIGVIDNGHTAIYQGIKKDAHSVKGLYIKSASKSSINTDLILGKYSGVIKLTGKKSFTMVCLDDKLKGSIRRIFDKYFRNGELKEFGYMLSEMKKGSMTSAERSGGLILMTLMISCTLCACNMIKDQSEGVLKRFSLSNSKPYAYAMGAFIYNLINSMVQIIIAVIVLNISKINIGISSLQFLMLGGGMTIIASSFGCLIVSISQSELQASSIASAVAVIMSLLGGAFLPLEKMPSLLKYISNGTVTKWLLILIKHMERGTTGSAQRYPVAIILGISVLMVVAGSKLSEKKFV